MERNVEMEFLYHYVPSVILNYFKIPRLLNMATARNYSMTAFLRKTAAKSPFGICLLSAAK